METCRQQVPRPRDRYPATVDCIESRRTHGAVIGNHATVRIGRHEVRELREAERGFHFARVIAGVIEDLLLQVRRQAAIPVAQKQMHGSFTRQFTQYRFEIVSAMAVDDHQLANPRASDRFDKIAKHRQERAGVEVHRERKGRKIGFGSVRDRRKHDDSGPPPMSRLAREAGDGFAFEHVCAVRKMQVVRFRCSHRQHGHFVRVGLDVGVVGFR